jgi:hypothetical protein
VSERAAVSLLRNTPRSTGASYRRKVDILNSAPIGRLAVGGGETNLLTRGTMMETGRLLRKLLRVKDESAEFWLFVAVSTFHIKLASILDLFMYGQHKA